MRETSSPLKIQPKSTHITAGPERRGEGNSRAFLPPYEMQIKHFAKSAGENFAFYIHW